jgi:uncharacterized protein YdeI (YjbR/CyaY-like superfamily)
MKMININIATGVVHEVPDDLRKALISDESALERWEDLTPLSRNEWICWTITTKKPETRSNHVERTITELTSGKRRPCCWAGCAHRSDRVVKDYKKITK